MPTLVPGQRWISNAEPELGLGTLVRIEPRSVQVLFATAGVMRHYALHSAPLTRAEFHPGQRIRGNKQSFVIERVSENGGLYAYHAGERIRRNASTSVSPRSVAAPKRRARPPGAS